MMAGIESYAAALGKLNEIPKKTTGSTGTVSKLPYTGGTPTVSKLPYTGGTPEISKLGNGSSEVGSGVVKQGSGGVATNNYTGSFDVKLPDGTMSKAQYVNGVLQSALPDGTTVYTGGGAYEYRKNTEAQSDAMASSLLGMYAPGANNAYYKAQQQQTVATNAAVQKAVNDLEQQKTGTNLSYSELFRQLYLNRMNAEKNLGQQMAAQGINGGASETSRLGLSTSYADALRQGEQERLNTISDLDKAITDARLTGDISIAESAAENAIAGANSYASVLQSLISRNDALSQYNQNREDTLNWQTQQLDAENQAAVRAQVAEMLKQGEMPSDALLTKADLSREYATAMVNAYQPAVSEEQQFARSLALAILEKGQVPSDTLLKEANIDMTDAYIMAAAYQPVSSYTEEQAQVALAGLLKGQLTPELQKILEGYYGLPVQLIRKAYGVG